MSVWHTLCSHNLFAAGGVTEERSHNHRRVSHCSLNQTAMPRCLVEFDMKSFLGHRLQS